MISTQSYTFPRITNGTCLAGVLRTSASSSCSTKIIPIGSTMAGDLAVAGFNVIGKVIALTLKCLRGESDGQRLQGPCSPGLAGSVLFVPSSRTWKGSSQGAPPWFGAKGGRFPRWGRSQGNASLPVCGSKVIGGRFNGVGDA